MPEGETGQKVTIEPLEKGDKERTAMHADVMNEIIDRLNSLLSLSVVPTGSGKFIFADANVVLDLSSGGTGCAAGTQCVPDPPLAGVWVLGDVNGTMQWFQTDQCDCILDGGSA